MKVGTTLYHGSTSRLTTGFPTNPNGNWFALNPRQAILHALTSAGGASWKRPYLYIYKVIQSPNLVKFSSSANFNAFARNMGFQLSNGATTFAFSENNKKIAEKLCKSCTCDGWLFPTDQSQVMLCKPNAGFLKFVKVLEIKRPLKGHIYTKFSRESNTGMWTTTNINKFSTVPANLTRLIELNQPSPNHFYYIINKTTYQQLFFNSNGNSLNIPRHLPTFTHKGKTHKTWGNFRNLRGNATAKIMAARISEKTNRKVTPENVYVFQPATNESIQKQRIQQKAVNNYWNKLNERKKSNTNLNASMLYAYTGNRNRA